MDSVIKDMLEGAYFETVDEALARSLSKLEAHKEAVTAAAMLLSAMEGLEDDAAKSAVVALNLRPYSDRAA